MVAHKGSVSLLVGGTTENRCCSSLYWRAGSLLLEFYSSFHYTLAQNLP